MKKSILTTVCIMSLYCLSFAQTITQTVKGKVLDITTQEALVGANVILINSDPIIGVSTNIEGEFILENVPVGRHNIKVSMIGYENHFENGILISSGKQVILNIGLAEKVTEMNEVIIRPEIIKDKAINTMATAVSYTHLTLPTIYSV